jgi:toxin ParE1/3/4
VKTFKVEVSPAAERDLEDIWFFIAQENPVAASKVLNALQDCILSLGILPERAQLRPDIAQNARCLIQGNYLVIYEVNDATVEVVRVTYGAIDLTKLYT